MSYDDEPEFYYSEEEATRPLEEGEDPRHCYECGCSDESVERALIGAFEGEFHYIFLCGEHCVSDCLKCGESFIGDEDEEICEDCEEE